MSYVEEIAAAIRRNVPADLLPQGDTAVLFRIYAVLALAKGEDVALEDVHDAWSAWMTGIDPQHPSLVALAQLPGEVRRSDEPYLDAIRAVVRDHRIGR